MDQQGTDIIPFFYRFLGSEPGSATEDAARESMQEGLKAFTEGMTTKEPYFFGAEPGIVDFAFAPFALRIEILLSHYKDYHILLPDDTWDRYLTWWRAIKHHPSFVATMPKQESYARRIIEFYLPYSQGGGQQDVKS